MLEKNWALITGGAKGIGASLSLKLAKEGWGLILVGRDADALQKFARALPSGTETRLWTADLSAPHAAASLCDRWTSEKLFPRALLCNAGDYGELGPISDVSFERWKKSFDLNFFSTVDLVQKYAQAARKLPVSYRRKVLLMSGSGLGGSKVWAGISAYACAKAALYRFMEVAHEELHPQGIDINCLAPGAVKTGITQQAFAAGEGALGALFASTQKVLNEGGDSPELAAEATARLLSPECDGLSGRLISAKWDKNFLADPARVSADADLLRLRRVDNELFFTKAAKASIPARGESQ